MAASVKPRPTASGVSITPGQIQLTRTFHSAISSATDRVSAITPAFAVL